MRSHALKKKAFLATAAAAGITMVFPVLCVASENDIQTYTNTDFAMDTVVSETLYTTGDDINSKLTSVLTDVETNLLSWTNESSQIYKVNADSGKDKEISDELSGYLERLLKIAKDSDGAFDPTIGKLIRLWDIGGENQKIPEEAEIKNVLKDSGYQKVSLDGTTIRMDEGCSLDLGAAGKGIGCDSILEYLETQKDVSAALMNLGGSSVMTYGSKPDGSSWNVAVTDPRAENDDDYLGVVALNGTEFLSTSGDYEKYFIEDGVRYHHIMDPSTGYPAKCGVTGVTVVCDTGLEADALTTACFVLGVEKGAELLKTYGADGLFVDEDHHVYLTEGMKERFRLLADSYSVEDIIE